MFPARPKRLHRRKANQLQNSIHNHHYLFPVFSSPAPRKEAGKKEEKRKKRAIRIHGNEDAIITIAPLTSLRPSKRRVTRRGRGRRIAHTPRERSTNRPRGQFPHRGDVARPEGPRRYPRQRRFHRGDHGDGDGARWQILKFGPGICSV